MELTHQAIDLKMCVDEGHAPQDLIKREKGEEWLISNDAAYPLEKSLDWMNCNKGEAVRIPLVPYRLNPRPDLALAFMFSLGTRVSYDVGRPVARLHVATGVPLGDGSDDEQGRLQFWLGFAVKLG